jgi:hypothetical protein
MFVLQKLSDNVRARADARKHSRVTIGVNVHTSYALNGVLPLTIPAHGVVLDKLTAAK